jgi:transcriptional regulator with XRE-family HTH domain
MFYCRVREVAEQQRLTVANLARQAGVSASTVRTLWHNPHHNLKTSMLDKLACALQVPAHQLIRSVPDHCDQNISL